jgi:hypothetical protein
MNDVHKIAVFRKDVYILYMAEMACDCMILLFLWTFESSKFSSITGFDKPAIAEIFSINHYLPEISYWLQLDRLEFTRRFPNFIISSTQTQPYNH